MRFKEAFFFRFVFISFWLVIWPFSAVFAQDFDGPTSPATFLAEQTEALLPKQYAVSVSQFSQVAALRARFLRQSLPSHVDMVDYLFARYGFKAPTLSSDDLEKTLVALSFFPRSTFPLKKSGLVYVQDLVMEPSLQEGDLGLTGGGVVRLSEIALSREDGEGQLHTIFHEMVHDLDDYLGLPSTGAEWREISHWAEVNVLPAPPAGAGELIFFRWRLNKIRLLSQAGLASKYASDNERDDFAESVTAYCFQNDDFEKVSPDKYKFIKRKIFKSKPCNLGASQSSL